MPLLASAPVSSATSIVGAPTHDRAAVQAHFLAQAASPAPAPSKAPTSTSFGRVLAGGAALAAGAAVVARGRRSRRARLGRSAVGGWPSEFVPPLAAPGSVLNGLRWPESWPYTSEDFSRQDESDDVVFYNQPRFVAHVDDGFISALRNYYGEVFPTYANARILDICSSWISHYPEKKCWSHVSVTGMNEEELKRNAQADDYTVRNLNISPELPYESETFDIVTCTVSFDYLNKPLEVMKEVARVLKPGGLVILSTSNRCFPSKAVNIWLRTNDTEHVMIYGSYMHYAGGFDPPEAVDLSSALSRVGFADPALVIQAKKKMS